MRTGTELGLSGRGLGLQQDSVTGGWRDLGPTQAPACLPLGDVSIGIKCAPGVVGPAEADIDFDIIKNDNDTFTVKYTPPGAGHYTIMVLFANQVPQPSALGSYHAGSGLHVRGLCRQLEVHGFGGRRHSCADPSLSVGTVAKRTYQGCAEVILFHIHLLGIFIQSQADAGE